MKQKLYLLLFSLCWIVPAMAQKKDTVASFTLKEAIDYAQKKQSAILNAKLDEQIAANTVKQTIGIGLPQISGNATFQDFLNIPTQVLPNFISPAVYDVLIDKGVKDGSGNPIVMPTDFGPGIAAQFGSKYTAGMGLELNQLLFDGSYLVGLKASKTYKELSNKSLTRTRIETTVAVTKAYYSVLVSVEQLGLVDANLERLSKSLSDTRQLFKNGFAEQIDVDRLSVLSNNLETEKENILKLLELNVNLLKFQMGMTINSKLTLKDKIEDVSLVRLTVMPDTSAYRNRIEYSLLETQKRLNELDLKRYKSQFLPQLVGFASTSANYQASKLSDLFTRSFPSSVLGLKLSVPIFNGFQRTYQVRNARLEVLKTQNNLDNLEQSINLEVSQADIQFKNGERSLTNQKRNMELAREVLRVSKIKYDQGVGSSLEVTTAETALKEAQNNYITALYDMLINKVNLDKALGNINY